MSLCVFIGARARGLPYVASGGGGGEGITIHTPD